MKRLFFILLLAAPLRAEPLPIANDTDWKDTQGQEIRAQGGTIVRDGDAWWWLGVDTEPGPDGAPQNKAVRCYSSTDLSRWTPHGAVFTGKVPFRMHVARAANGEWVLFLNDVKPNGDNVKPNGNATIRLALAKSLQSPFVETAPLQVPNSAGMNSFSVFQDDDGAAWLLFACEQNTDKRRVIYAAKLAPDLKSVDNPQKQILAEGESPRLWKRNGVYHLATARSVGWTSHFPLLVTGPTPLGPWSETMQRWS